MAGPNDTIESNLTLYARFDIREDLSGEYATNYISVENVAPDCRVLLRAHNLSAEDVRERIAARNVSRGGEAIDFTVEEIVEPQEPEEPFSLGALELDEQMRADVEAAIKAEANSAEEYGLGVVLRDLGLDPDTVDVILKNCAPEEYEAEHSPLWVDEETRALAEEAGIGDDFAGLLNLNALYGLEEDDSPERY